MTEEKSLILEEIQARRVALRAELETLDRAELALFNKTSDVKPGDRVRRTYGPSMGMQFIVHEVHYITSRSSAGKPWVSGYQIRKDGSPGMKLKNLYYEWEKIDDGVSSESGEVKR